MADVSSQEKPKPHSTQKPDKPGWWWVWSIETPDGELGWKPVEVQAKPECAPGLYFLEVSRSSWVDVTTYQWGGICERDPTRDAVLAVMREMLARKRTLMDAYERTDELGHARFLDGGASRLIWALEELRKALDLPCEWDQEADQ